MKISQKNNVTTITVQQWRFNTWRMILNPPVYLYFLFYETSSYGKYNLGTGFEEFYTANIFLNAIKLVLPIFKRNIFYTNQHLFKGLDSYKLVISMKWGL